MEPAKESEKSSSARARLFDAALLELGERGIGGLALTDVLARAEVSADVFGAEFDDLDSCLFAAYDDLTERLLQRAAARCELDEDWPLRVRAGLDTLLDELATQPQMARVLTRSFPAIRPQAHLRYMEFLESFTPLLREGRDRSNLNGEHPGEIEMFAIGSAEALVFEEIEAGRTAELPAQAPSILFAVLVPFLGREEALAITDGEAG